MCSSDSGARGPGVECVGKRKLEARRDPYAGRSRLIEHTRSEGVFQQIAHRLDIDPERRDRVRVDVGVPPPQSRHVSVCSITST